MLIKMTQRITSLKVMAIPI